MGKHRAALAWDLRKLVNTPFAFARGGVVPRPGECQEHPAGHPECDATIWAAKASEQVARA